MSASRKAATLPHPTPTGKPHQRSGKPYPWLHPGILLGGLVPLASIVMRASQNALGANPIAQIQNELGLTALIFLMAALACTPARHLFGWTWQMRMRRTIGLFAFFYAVVHFLTYLVVDQFFDLRAIADDIAERPFITVGFLALVLLVPIAITSTNGWGEAARVQALAAGPPTGISGGRAGGGAFHLAGEDRRQPAADLRRLPDDTAGDTGLLLASQALRVGWVKLR